MCIRDRLLSICPENYPIDVTVKENHWIENQPLTGEAQVILYTDGSKEGDRTGAGWLATHGDLVLAEDCMPLGEKNTVFQAEVIAISEALTWIKANLDEDTLVSVRSDSQAAIQAILGRICTSKLVKECKLRLALAKESLQVHLEWIKGHADFTGNEAADMLAKRGNQHSREMLGPTPAVSIPLVEIKNRIKDKYMSKWQVRWTNTETCTR